jgi:hypothetical protein
MTNQSPIFPYSKEQNVPFLSQFKSRHRRNYYLIIGAWDLVILIS